VAVLAVTELQHDGAWSSASGLARLEAAGPLEGIHLGDEVDVIGRLVVPQEPANPGEFDYAARLRDQGIRAEVIVEKTASGVVRLAEGWSRSPRGWLALVKGWGQRVLDEHLPPEQSGLAQALLLGRHAPLRRADWDRYVRGGVVHVLVVSGLHVALLGWCLWQGIWLLGVRRRYGAVAVAALLLGYALLTGPGMPILRAGVAAVAVCLGVVLRRPAQPANLLALAWLAVALVNPADIFDMGCQLSFLAVVVLQWCVSPWLHPKADPLEKLLEETEPAWKKRLLWTGRLVGRAYLATLAVWLAQAPLTAANVHVVSPVALVIAPPLMALSALALGSGFLLLTVAAVAPPLAPLPAWLTGRGLAGCDWLVRQSLSVPGSSFYVTDVPAWWLWAFYLGLLAALLLEPLRRRWRWAALAGLAWLCVGLVAVLHRPASDELRCTFLAVGHGGCAVLESPDGRVLLYDAGSLAGPEVTRRQIAPFLWSRGIRRVDEVLLSHADLDHFNGLPALLDTFAVGQVTCTPTFSEKPTAGVHRVVEELTRRGVSTRVVRAGDWLTAGDVQMEVLHPPPRGPEGNENSRSLVLLVRHAGHALLLTGDLEGPGLQRVLTLPPAQVDILMSRAIS
jgi:competence protein ComEC